MWPISHLVMQQAVLAALFALCASFFALAIMSLLECIRQQPSGKKGTT